ncbi:MAG: SCO family protein [Sinimarinibacterium sp.]
MRNRNTLLILVAALAAIAGLLVAAFLRAPDLPAIGSGTLLQAPRALPAFALLDENAQPFTNQNLQGHWTLIFPGFTYCPDVCPTTLGLLKNVEAQLGAKAQGLQVVLFSVDPERDTPEALNRYVRFFSPRFKAATTAEPALKAFAQALGIAYVKVPGETSIDGADSYTMDHSAALVLVNPRGELAGYFTPPLSADALVRDLGRVMEQAS